MMNSISPTENQSTNTMTRGVSFKAVIAQDLSLSTEQVQTVLTLLSAGMSIPYIAKYCMDQLGDIDAPLLRIIQRRSVEALRLEVIKKSMIQSIIEREQLTDRLNDQISEATTFSRLSDLYRPFRTSHQHHYSEDDSKRIDELANHLLANSSQSTEQYLENILGDRPESSSDFSDKWLEFAEQRLVLQFYNDADLIKHLKEYFWQRLHIKSESMSTSELNKALKGRGVKNQKRLKRMSALKQTSLEKLTALQIKDLLQGRHEGIINFELCLEDNTAEQEANDYDSHDYDTRALQIILKHLGRLYADGNKPLFEELSQRAWYSHLKPNLEIYYLRRLNDWADEEIIKKFTDRLKLYLMAAPAGPKVIMGLEPALKSGVKIVVINAVGNTIAHTVIFPHTPQNQRSQALRKLVTLCEMYKVELISIGSGTGSGETEQLVQELIQKIENNKPQYQIMDNVAANLFANSTTCETETIDVNFMRALSLARRLQDPLFELVKIDLRSLSLGFNQQEVDQNRLSKSVANAIEDCVNAVGVDLNTSNLDGLAAVSGMTRILAEKIINHRNTEGDFSSVKELSKLDFLSDEVIQQCSGFLWTKAELKDSTKLRVDPRPKFKIAKFDSNINSINDLEVGMKLQGVVSRVQNFGVFVNIGIEQQGLVHISKMVKGFVDDPNDIIKNNDIVDVWVVATDTNKRQISLSMLAPENQKCIKKSNNKRTKTHLRKTASTPKEPIVSAFAAALTAAIDNKE